MTEHRRLERFDEATLAYRRAIDLTDNSNARVFLEERLSAIDKHELNPW